MVSLDTVRHRCALIVAMLLGVVVAAGPAAARNVPGSANAAAQELSEIATDSLVGGITDGVRQLRSGGGAVVSTMGNDGFSFHTRGEAGTMAAASARWRRLDTDDIQGNIGSASLTFGRAFDPGIVGFVALLAERVDVETDFNAGTLDGTGVGLAAGVDLVTANDWAVSVMAGGMALDYDMTRSGGAVSGSFDAKRWFVNLQGERTAFIGNSEIRVTLGMRYLHQTDDAYAETGGGAMAESSTGYLVGFASGRTYLGRQADEMRPFAEADLRFARADSSGLPAALSSELSHGARYGIGLGLEKRSGNTGFEARVGATFDEDGASGLDARLNLNFRF